MENDPAPPARFGFGHGAVPACTNCGHAAHQSRCGWERDVPAAEGGCRCTHLTGPVAPSQPRQIESPRFVRWEDTKRTKALLARAETAEARLAELACAVRKLADEWEHGYLSDERIGGQAPRALRALVDEGDPQRDDVVEPEPPWWCRVCQGYTHPLDIHAGGCPNTPEPDARP